MSSSQQQQPMIVRVRSPAGTVRVESQQGESLSDFHTRLSSQIQVHPSSLILSKDPSQQNVIHPGSFHLSLSHHGIRHGDMLYAHLSEGKWEDLASSSSSSSKIQEDEVDKELDKIAGTIPKQTDSTASMRLSDLPVDPFDKKYLKEKQIKHLSYHAMIRKSQSRLRDAGLDPSRIQFLQDDVDELARRVQKPSTKQIKVTDLPSAVVLTRQEFRMVDHVEFESGSIVDSFIQGWRSSGLQRFGYMYGRYEVHSEIPLGIKAVVSFIYEPPQSGGIDGIEFADEDPDQDLVNAIAALFGMRKVGMIYTDLIDDKSGTGRVLAKRHANSYFLSSPEIIFVANQQIAHPSPCKYSSTGKFGSKFVTLVICGDPENETNNNIGLAAYQVSNQAMALVKADIIQATVEPALLRVVNDPNRIIPDVLYRYQNEYNVEVTQTAKPTFPVEYLLVNVNYGFPIEPKPTFCSSTPFPIENRPLNAPDISYLNRHLTQNASLQTLCDFHLLFFLAKTKIFSEDDYRLLCTVVHTRDEDRMRSALFNCESWRNLMTILKEVGSSPVKAFPSASPSAAPSQQDIAQYQAQLSILKEMGFSDTNLLVPLLVKYNGDMENVLHRLTS